MSSAAKPHTRTIDGVQLRALLRCYFILSTRGKLAQSMGGRHGRKPRGLIFVVVLYCFAGLMTAPLAFAHPDVFTFSVIMHTMTFFVVGMAVTSESGDVLFNANENDVLVHRPISSRTLLLAKSLNLIGFTSILAGALNLFPSFFGLAARGARPWYPLVHGMSVVLLSAFCSAAAIFVYGLIVRCFDREKFDNFAVWSQVGLSVIFIGGYQILPRIMQHFEGLSLQSFAVYLLPLPPAWFAALDSLGGGTDRTGSLFMLAAVGLAVTSLLTYAAIGRLAPSYGEALAKLGEARSRTRRPRRVPRATWPAGNPVLRWWLRDPIERAAFRLAAAYMRRDREIKLRLYPSLSMFVVLPLMGMLGPEKGGFSGFIPLLAVWMAGTLPSMALETLRMSSHHAAADLFAVAPLAGPGALFQGVRKAALCYLVLPVLCMFTILIVCLVPNGGGALLLGLPGLIALPTLSLVSGLSGYLPLSRPPMRGEQAARNSALMLSAMLGMGGLLAAAYFALKLGFFWSLVAAECVIMVLLHWAATRYLRQRPMPRD